MAALCVSARASLVAVLNNARPSRGAATSRVAPAITQIQQRWSSYKSSSKYTKPEDYTDYEISNDPNEWKYVERLLRYKIIPKPPSTTDVELPSGYKPAQALPKDTPYFVERTKNYMQPVYLQVNLRKVKRVTKIRKIQGDIWKLDQDLKEYIEDITKQKIASQIFEFAGLIILRGDHVSRVKKWMDMKGF
ncbi:probable 39S ribosomal protein L49, mitochondrial isoform X1 [Pseudomyrmex gracilis]|uniref:probable 39S ribosomal protein L49, mitochondrial isoform X1 n=1 Tax=Pseudomyrmex gracilis TaxID=219809 RepID=UPI000994BC72|nr:probable 39S ribosomal protein L49, mitochondrial isoform X1 [Pseudomyrmex gracilis]